MNQTNQKMHTAFPSHTRDQYENRNSEYVPPKDDCAVEGYFVADEVFATIPSNSFFTVEWDAESIKIYRNFDDAILEHEIPISSLLATKVMDNQLHLDFVDSRSGHPQVIIIKAMPQMLTEFKNAFGCFEYAFLNQ